ncbi:MAG: Universal stress protein family [Polyangiaceae bacterium]|jgi:nucleotide-binding universal stress UspA family protein|nr:Universal stress protein family [Polyangiaceae bacterium]
MILCGTDLSIAAEQARKSAGALARKTGEQLLLVTVLERERADDRAAAEDRLERDANDLRNTFDIAVETVIVQGAPDQRLLELATSRQASLIVVGAEGASKRAGRLGSVPEQLCQGAAVPVLVARSAEPLVAWSQRALPLRVLLGSGLGDASRSALAYVSTWQDLALTVAHVAWPYGEHYRLGVDGPMPLEGLRPEVHSQLIGDLGRWAAETPCRSSPKLSVTPGWGRIDSHLAQLAEQHGAELLVVGTHQRGVANRLWHGSVSRNAIHEASCNVLCVPARYLRRRTGQAPRTLVVPTDFSALGDRAVSYAYALLTDGGAIHLVHVVENLRKVDAAAVKAQLAARVPTDAEIRRITTETHVLEGGAAWLAIWQQAGRASADLICMATHSRDAAANWVLGSQAQALLHHSRIPVLLVPPDRES